MRAGRRQRWLLSIVWLATACPTGEVVEHPPCQSGETLVGRGAEQRCLALDAGPDASAADAGGDVDGGPPSDAGLDGGRDAGGDAGLPCDDRCAEPSVCDGDACVVCAQGGGGGPDPGCDEGAPHCDETEPRECRACLTNAHCSDPDAARCEGGECAPCQQAPDCADQGARDLCDDGRCVECTVGTEAADCGAHSCDPATGSCTRTDRQSRAACETCLADSECEADHHCVPMFWDGVQRDSMYCLPDRHGACGRLYASRYDGRTSASGERVDVCGPSETLTTCEAVLDMVAATACGGADACGDPAIADDGACDGAFCTIPCSTSAECPMTRTCGASLTCER